MLDSLIVIMKQFTVLISSFPYDMLLKETAGESPRLRSQKSEARFVLKLIGERTAVVVAVERYPTFGAEQSVVTNQCAYST